MNESCRDARFVRLSLRSRWRDAVVLQSLFLFVFLLAGIANAQVKLVRRVLIIHEVGAYLPLSDYVDRGIRTSFASSLNRIVVNREFMRAGNMLADSDQEVRNFIIDRYRNHQPDVIIVVGEAPLQFITETHEKAFRGVPIVFCLPDRLLASLPEEVHFTGVVGDIAAAKTLDAALRLRPGTKHVIVIGGVGDVDLERNAAIQNQLKSYESRLQISYFTGVPVPDLVQRLRSLPSDTIVLLGNLGLDSVGNLYSTAESGAIVAGNANVPVFSLIDRSLNHGEVGGKVSDSVEQGKIAGEMALRILNGEKPQQIPIMKDVSTYMFDWRALQRWGLKESNLPPGSIVLNRQPSFWEAYWRYVAAALLLLAAQAFVIAGLLWQRARRKKAELDLLDSNLQLRASEEKFSTAFHRSPLAITLTGAQDGRYIDVNETFEEATGWSRQEVIGRTPFDLGIWPERQRTDLQQHVSSYGGVQNLEFSFLTKAGEIRTGLGSMELIEIGGEQCVLSVATDITERKHAHEKIQRALQEGEERFRLVANTAPVMIWMSGLDKRATYFNQRWLDFRGRSLESELVDDWVHDIHSEDQQRCLDAAAQAFEQQKSFTIEYRLRRYDGEYRWVLDTGVPRFKPDGSFAGFIGSVVDVTDLKRAEKALSSLSGRLIEAQEQERRHIARELHDDISQQLALLSVGLQYLAAKLPESEPRLRDEVKVILRRTTEVASNVHTLSHRLHTSKLEVLGLVTTMRSFCRELSEQRKVEVDFSHRDVPDDLPQQTSLCLFRVLQEGLNNAVKHSGVRKFDVQLERVSNKLQLRIRDQGAGFDPGMEMFTTGLGLISMRERVTLVKGSVAIESKPQCGTDIKITVPIPANTELKRSSASG